LGATEIDGYNGRNRGCHAAACLRASSWDGFIRLADFAVRRLGAAWPRLGSGLVTPRSIATGPETFEMLRQGADPPRGRLINSAALAPASRRSASANACVPHRSMVIE